jgi:hypothetical protein
LTDEEKSSEKGPNYLGDDVPWNLFPRKTLPSCKTYRYCGIEVPSRGRSASDNRKRDANGVRRTNLKERTESGFCFIQEERCLRGNSRVSLNLSVYMLPKEENTHT